MGSNAHIREIGSGSGGAQRVVSSGPCNTPQQQQPQDGRRSWSDLFDWGHHNGVRISQAGDSHGS